MCGCKWICAECVFVCMCGLILTKPMNVCLTLIQSRRLIGVSAPRICACVCVYKSLCAYSCYGLAGGKLSLLNAVRESSGSTKSHFIKCARKGQVH